MPIETYISIDVETAGPAPSQYALLSIGACLALDRAQTFYVELQPDKEAVLPEALTVSGLNMDELAQRGLPPEQALQQFEAWTASVTPPDGKPVFVAFNAPFDWMFVADYFHRYLGHNPFGHSALDMKAYFMGQNQVAWSETGFAKVNEHFDTHHPLTHNALQDAIDQAVVFKKMLKIK
jgi:ribonuclease T